MNKNIILFLKYKNEIKNMNKSKKDYLYYQNLNKVLYLYYILNLIEINKIKIDNIIRKY